MLMFLLGIVILIVGYCTYGKFIESILGPDDRDTPAKTSYDGVDYLVLPHWKNMLIQLLNIAGVGPVIGVILGIKFGGRIGRSHNRKFEALGGIILVAIGIKILISG